MALRLLTSEKIMELSRCPVCEAERGERCDPSLLNGRSESHAQRVKDARHAEYEAEKMRAKRREVLKA